MPSLLVALPPASAPAAGESGYAQVADDGSTLLSQGSAPLALLPAGDDVTVVLGIAALSWHQVTLPQGSIASDAPAFRPQRPARRPAARRTRNLHFALEPDARAGAPVWVAACNRTRCAPRCRRSRRRGAVSRASFPNLRRRRSARRRDGGARRGAGAAAGGCDASGVALLPLAAAGLALAGNLPLDTVVLPPSRRSRRRPRRSSRPACRSFNAPSAGCRQCAAPGIWRSSTSPPPAGPAPARSCASMWQTLWHAPRWRAARWGALVLVLAQLIGLNAWAWKERNALEAKRAGQRILTQTFPSVTLVVDAPVQMAREVAALQQATGGVSAPDLEPMLGALGTSLPPGRMPNAIDYSAGQLRLRGLGLTAEELEPLGARWRRAATAPAAKAICCWCRRRRTMSNGADRCGPAGPRWRRANSGWSAGPPRWCCWRCCGGWRSRRRCARCRGTHRTCTARRPAAADEHAGSARQGAARPAQGHPRGRAAGARGVRATAAGRQRAAAGAGPAAARASMCVARRAGRCAGPMAGAGPRQCPRVAARGAPDARSGRQCGRQPAPLAAGDRRCAGQADERQPVLAGTARSS